MLRPLFSSAPVWPQEGISVIRMIVGLLMVYHGFEIFKEETIKGYTDREPFKNYSFPLIMVYIGKTSEFFVGILLTLGFLTRISCAILILIMLYISFFVGGGKIWYEDQHPFLFVLIALVFIFTGPGKWSIDHWRSKQDRDQITNGSQ